MSPIARRTAGSLLSLQLADEMRALDQELGGEHTRIGRTLIKEGPLRVALVGLAPGGALHEHEAEGPVTIHVLRGELSLEAGGAPGHGAARATEGVGNIAATADGTLARIVQSR